METKQTLMDWSMENGEDVLFDGPYDISSTQWTTLTSNISNRLVKEIGVQPINNIEDVFNVSVDVEEAYGIMLECLADLINKENITKMW